MRLGRPARAVLMASHAGGVARRTAGSGLADLGLAGRVGRPHFGVGRVTLANQPIQLTKDPPPRLLSQPRHGRPPFLG